MNSLTLTGNLGKDAEIRYLNDGKPVVSFSVADSMGKDKPSIWWNCAMFNDRAVKIAPYLTKGQQVTVVGTVTEREYTDKTGQQRKSMDVRVQDVALQGGKRDQQDGGHQQAPQQQRQAAPAPRQAPPTRQAPVAQSGFTEDDSDIPF